MADAAANQGSQSLADWLRVVRADFVEVPGLHLTLAQARRFWGLDELTSVALFGALVDTHFLKQTRDGSYVRVGGH